PRLRGHPPRRHPRAAGRPDLAPAPLPPARRRRARPAGRRGRGRGPRALAMLEIRGITKQFGGLTALQDVTFTVGRGELVALVGPNGAGKSTLFNIIAGAFPPTRGRIVFEGRDVTSFSSHDLAR